MNEPIEAIIVEATSEHDPVVKKFIRNRRKSRANFVLTVGVLACVIMVGTLTILSAFQIRENIHLKTPLSKLLDEVGDDPYELHRWCTEHITIVDTSTLEDDATLNDMIDCAELTIIEVLEFKWNVMAQYQNTRARLFYISYYDLYWTIGILYEYGDHWWYADHVYTYEAFSQGAGEWDEKPTNFAKEVMPDATCAYDQLFGDKYATRHNLTED